MKAVGCILFANLFATICFLALAHIENVEFNLFVYSSIGFKLRDMPK